MADADLKQSLVSLVNAGEPAITLAAEQLNAKARTKLLCVLLDNFGQERVKEAVRELPARDATRVFEGTVEGILAKRGEEDNSGDQRLANALASLDEGHAAQMLEALGQRKPRPLLSAAARVLRGDRRPRMQDLGLETEDVLRRVAAEDASQRATS